VGRCRDYEALFAGADDGALCGESTVFYLYGPFAQRRIREVVPDARLIAVLRDAVERAHSTGRTCAAGLEPEADFLRALDRKPRRIGVDWAHFLALHRAGPLRRAAQAPLRPVPRRAVLVQRYREVPTPPPPPSTGSAASSASPRA
jgi:hypothetical protein